ncbi:MAG: TonB family protein [Bacteroidota bacterium]
MNAEATPKSRSSNDLADILFQDKNLSYGAYVLRRAYASDLGMSFLISVFVLVMVFVSPLIIDWLKGEEEEEPIKTVRVLSYSELSAPPPIERKKVPPPPKPEIKIPPKKSQLKFIPPKVKPDEEVKDEEVPTQDDLLNKLAGTETVVGNDSIGLDEGDPDAVEMPEEVIAAPPPPKEEVFDFVAYMPEFPGGSTELLKFLTREIVYPSRAKEFGVQGVVVIKFVVQADGEITKVGIIQGLHPDCDNEAIRAIRRMPKWIPGRNGEFPVPVRVVMPVHFKLVDR